ncbi:unnamed protein product [Hermetia illucens]|uniref:Peptidoglycan-recognition protein n=1 Tax=Hermetia illucens TaxID=343691 RepID=A0A7R8V4B0_HERIL|nr:peptidoglycan-recognition protein LB-like [Hermetia illucens]CAD7092428.1 unnamed protein product [Hermetia illucens]
MFKLAGVVLILSVLVSENSALITRAQWGARTSKSVSKFSGQIPYVVIHHTYEPAVCLTTEDCIAAMQYIQDLHMDQNGWGDIGYSFAVGGDGEIYEGRGWNVVGAHAPGYNSKSVGIVFIGDYRTDLPSFKMLKAAVDFIAAGVTTGLIAPDYKLIGHRQAKATECPGDRLFSEIITWDHWTASPTPN